MDVKRISELLFGSCSETADHMSEYLDGELDGSIRRRLRRHLFVCKVCRPLYESLRRAVTAIREQPPEAASADPALVADVMDRIRSLPPDDGPRHEP